MSSATTDDPIGVGHGGQSIARVRRSLPTLSLESIRIASPCTASWEDMRGDAKSRHCDQCDKQVHDLSQMTRAEAEGLVNDAIGAGGHPPCVRLWVRKDGTVLTAKSSPSIKFPSAGKSGIKVILTDDIVVDEGATTEVLLDFDAEESFVLRGNTIMQNGLLFKPVIKATIHDE